MNKNKERVKLNIILYALSLASALTVLLPILLTFIFEVFVARRLTSTDSQEPAGSGFIEFIIFLATIGVFVLIINIASTLILLKKYKLSGKQTKIAKGLLTVSILLPIAYFVFLIAIRFI